MPLDEGQGSRFGSGFPGAEKSICEGREGARSEAEVKKGARDVAVGRGDAYFVKLRVMV
jgi:hypothetical protein